jgi:hypothetical protein
VKNNYSLLKSQDLVIQITQPGAGNNPEMGEFKPSRKLDTSDWL